MVINTTWMGQIFRVYQGRFRSWTRRTGPAHWREI